MLTEMMAAKMLVLVLLANMVGLLDLHFVVCGSVPRHAQNIAEGVPKLATN